MIFFKNYYFCLVEVKIFLLVIKAEIYNIFSTSLFKRIRFFEKSLEKSCEHIANELKNLEYPERKFSINKKIIIVSRIQKGGGLSKVLKTILNREKFFLIATNIFNYRSKRIKKTRFIQESIFLNNFSLLKRIGKLVSYFSNRSTKEIHILNDSTDPIPYIAFLICSKEKKSFNFYHHSDHSYSFGMFEKGWNHIDLFQNQFHVCKKEIDSKFISLTNFL